MPFKNLKSVTDQPESIGELKRINVQTDSYLEIYEIAGRSVKSPKRSLYAPDHSASYANFGGKMGIEAVRKTKKRGHGTGMARRD